MILPGGNDELFRCRNTLTLTIHARISGEVAPARVSPTDVPAIALLLLKVYAILTRTWYLGLHVAEGFEYDHILLVDPTDFFLSSAVIQSYLTWVECLPSTVYC